MEIAIKYCGGCNPKYDRIAFAERLKKENPEIIFSHAEYDKETDFLLVICGCTAACAFFDNIKTRYGHVLISNETKFEHIQEIINRLKKDML